MDDLEIPVADSDAASFINDIRTPAEFKGVTFSGYKLSDVRAEYIKSLGSTRVEAGCNWSAEMVCAGHFAELWDCVFVYMSKHIHVGNPKIAIYVGERYDLFRQLMSQGYYTNDMQARNTSKIRRLFAEITCVLALADKKQSFTEVKIDRSEEFEMGTMRARLKAPAAHYADAVIMPEDPREMCIPLNEFAHSIAGDTPNLLAALYWIEWVIEFDALCRKRGEKCACVRRTYVEVEPKFQRDVVWMIWDVIAHYAQQRAPIISKTAAALMRLFCARYTTAACRRRKLMLYFAASLFTETVCDSAEIAKPRDRAMIQSVDAQIDLVYRTIKKNEHSPNTDYLFSSLGEGASAFDRTVRKLEAMDALTLGMGDP
jgi:hypothetical protein